MIAVARCLYWSISLDHHQSVMIVDSCQVIGMLQSIQERRMVDEHALRYAINDAGAIRIDDFYKWSGKEVKRSTRSPLCFERCAMKVLLEWIDRFSAHFEIKLARLKVDSPSAMVPSAHSVHCLSLLLKS